MLRGGVIYFFWKITFIFYSKVRVWSILGYYVVMPYFLHTVPLSLNKPFILEGDEAHHLIITKRARAGEIVTIQDPEHKRFSCKIVSISKKSCELLPQEKLTPPPEPKLRITIYQALTSEQALDFIITKATELGASKICFFQADLSPHSIKGKEEKKLERWNKIALEAAKQSMRLTPPKIMLAHTLSEALSNVPPHEVAFFLDINSGSTCTLPSKAETVSLFVGPEGGWSQAERTLSADLTTLQLGPRILKAETAALAGITILQHQLGDM